MASLRHSDNSLDQTIELKRAHTVVMPRGNGYGVSGVTGTIATALTANSSVFVARYNPSAGAKIAIIERIRLQFTTLVAFTTPVTAGRRLALFRGAGAAASGGAALAAIAANAQKDTSIADTEFAPGIGGDMRISTTAALTVTGITYETDPFRIMTLSHVGAAGAFFEQLWEFSVHECHPLILRAGQLIGIRNPVAMDAAGTWQLAVNMDWTEITPV